MKILQLLALLVPLAVASKEQKTQRYLLITKKEMEDYRSTAFGMVYFQKNIAALPDHQYVDVTAEEYEAKKDKMTDIDGQTLEWILVPAPSKFSTD